MIKVLHKRLRKINGYLVRGTARQGLQLARQRETKTALPKLKKGSQGASCVRETFWFAAAHGVEHLCLNSLGTMGGGR